MTNLKRLFLTYCRVKKLEINVNQLIIIELLIKFYRECFKKTFFRNLFSKKIIKKSFYLVGDVGVGKTMLLNFFYDNFKFKKKKFHFNEFMINFHNFAHKNKKDSIESFVKELKKKYELLYFDEFQVTNIVDAMILGKLFENIFKENIKIIISSNIKIKDLYKDGLQRDQFIPFIQLIKKFCIEHELTIDQDYRKYGISKLERFFYPVNEKTFFQISSIFREISKKKVIKSKEIFIKGRKFIIENYLEGFARFNFADLCSTPIGAEDYIKIAECCNFITIDDIPDFNDDNADKQQRFITLIDILYEKKIPLMIK